MYLTMFTDSYNTTRLICLNILKVWLPLEVQIKHFKNNNQA